MELKFTKIKPDAMLPSGQDRDIHSIISVKIKSEDYAVIPTGLAVDVPEGCVLQMCSKRSIAEKWQVVVINDPAVIHHGFSGEIVVILKNHSCMTFHIEEGDAIAQVVLLPVVQFEPVFAG